IFSYYAYLLNEKYENLLKNKYYILDDSILAFRKLNKSNIDFARIAFDSIRSAQNCTVLGLDISKFFDHIDHKILKDMWCKVLGVPSLPEDHHSVFKAITKFVKVDRDTVFEFFNISLHNPRKNGKNRICSPREFREYRKLKKPDLFNDNPAFFINKGQKGIPQGSPISALLSNIYMLEFDVLVKEKIMECKGSYFRYCDDILCIIPNEYEEFILDYITGEIKSKLKLEINKDKTEVVKFQYCNRTKKIINEKKLQYLGFILHNNSISIRSSAFTRYSNKMKRGVSLAKQTQGKYNRIRIRRGVAIKGIYKRKLFSKYSHFGKSNFISYGKRAYSSMDSKVIKNQLKPLWYRLKKEIYL
ncbi:TPA: group II intron reverse transcriptase domain-containing protein, partial [Mannheimia haemolytica]|nr:group II intron reverse transcriptase domain-containing protein [Mannheimia haemolytica]HDL6028240.1 group II intron reverse transcriptase domain-containing protein [Mannheimia haemolytica]